MDDLDDFECDDFDKTLKVIVVGNGNVGKTSLTTRYAKGRYTGNYKKTIGVDFMEKRLELRDLNATVNLLIWDTAGQEEFGALTSRYYKGAGAVVYVFSTTDRASFDDLFKWQRKVEHECGRIAHVLVQNKIDLVDEAAMTRREVEVRADAMRVKLFRACVQDNVNVSEVFEYLARQYLKRGGRDDALEAVTDISTLSSQPSPSYERRSRSGREDSDAGSDGRRGGSSSPSDRASRGRDHERSTGWGSGRLERVDADERGRKNRRNEYDEQDDSDDEWRSSRESKDRHRGWDRDDGEDRRGGRERRSERERPRDRDRDRDHDRDRDRSDRDDRRAKDRDRAQGRRHEEWEDRDRERDRGLDRERDRDRGDDRDRDRERRDRGRGRDREHDGGREQDRDRGGRRHREGERERGRSGDRDRETDLKDGDAPNDMKNRSRNRGKDLDDDDCNSDGESIHISDRLGSRKDRGRDEPSSRTKDKMEAERSPSLAHKDDNEPVVKEDSARDTEAEAGSPTASVRSGEFEKNERDSRQNSRSMRESDQVSVKDKKSPSRPQSDKNSEPDAHKPLDKATLRAQLREGQDSDSESEKRNGIKIDGGKASTNASESSRIQPSKRRTNGKKTNPLLYKLSKLVYS